MKLRLQTIMALHLGLLGVAVAAAILTSRSEDWMPLGLFAALVALAVASDLLSIEVRGLHLSGTFAAIMIALALLGPAPGMCVALAPVLVHAIRQRPNRHDLASNFATYAAFPLLGGIGLQAVGFEEMGGVAMALSFLAAFMVVNALNFALIYGYRVAAQGWSWKTGIRDLYLPVIPAQIGIAVITTSIVYAAASLGPGTIIVLAPVVLVFQWLLTTVNAAYERGVELEDRNRQLASLQFGLISTMLKTLSLRDNMTARHSAAVARYSRAVAVELGLSEEEQELIHTAALFHDIGKFIFPDSILMSTDGLTDEEYAIVRRHPEVGADVIREIEGYGPVAEIVLHHHERIDGRGYPAGICGDAIPLGSRIIAVADTYDVITARDTYRDVLSLKDAVAELRRSAGTQLDARLVEIFIGLISDGGLVFRHAESDDFEAELALERRVTAYASPRQKAVA